MATQILNFAKEFLRDLFTHPFQFEKELECLLMLKIFKSEKDAKEFIEMVLVCSKSIGVDCKSVLDVIIQVHARGFVSFDDLRHVFPFWPVISIKDRSYEKAEDLISAVKSYYIKLKLG